MKKMKQILKKIITVMLASAMVSTIGGMLPPQLITAVYAADGVEYIDADGNLQTRDGVTEITHVNKPALLDAEWYVVKGTVDYDTTITISANVNLILADGATLNIGTEGQRVNECGIKGDYDSNAYALTIYGQSGGSGALNVYGNTMGIHVDNLTVNGGHCIVDSANNNAIDIVNYSGAQSVPGLTMNGGELIANASSTNLGYKGVLCANYSKFIFNGGRVTATTAVADKNDGILASGGYFINSYRSVDDEITVNSFKTNTVVQDVIIDNGITLVDEDGTQYSGNVRIVSLNDKASSHASKTITLRPLSYTASISDGISNGRVTANKERVFAGDTVTLTVIPDDGYSLDSLTVITAGGGKVETRGSGNRYEFTMPGDNVTVNAAFSKQTTTVPPINPGDTYASPDDNIAPVSSSGKIKELVLDFSNVAGSGIDPAGLKMTAINGSKFTTKGKLKSKDSVKTTGGINVKVGKDLIPKITCKKDGTATVTMADGNTYTIKFTVQKPKAQKSAKKMSKGGSQAIKTVHDLFGTDINAGKLEILKQKHSQAKVSDNNLYIDPKEKDSVKLQYKYLNKKYKMTVKVK